MKQVIKLNIDLTKKTGSITMRLPADESYLNLIVIGALTDQPTHAPVEPHLPVWIIQTRDANPTGI